MSLIVILICLGVQRFFKIYSASHQLNWIGPYYQWMSSKLDIIKKNSGFISLIILILPLLIAVGIVFSLAYHLFTVIGYFIFNLILLWYCLDARDLKKEPTTSNTYEQFTSNYRNLFAILFWYFVFGPVGLTLYYSVTRLRAYLESLPITEQTALTVFTSKTQGVLDWVPLRLLGFTYALVGHFTAGFKLLQQEFFTGITNNQNQAAEWGYAALQNPAPEMTDTVALIERALMVWLVVMALLSIAFWMG